MKKKVLSVILASGCILLAGCTPTAKKTPGLGDGPNLALNEATNDASTVSTTIEEELEEGREEVTESTSEQETQESAVVASTDVEVEDTDIPEELQEPSLKNTRYVPGKSEIGDIIELLWEKHGDEMEFQMMEKEDLLNMKWEFRADNGRPGYYATMFNDDFEVSLYCDKTGDVLEWE